MNTPTLAVDNGPTLAVWNAMIGQPGKYLPLIERVVGLFIMRDIGKTEEMLWDDDLKAAIPALSDLSDDEVYFVRAGAQSVYFQGDLCLAIREVAGAWLDDGAPE